MREGTLRATARTQESVAISADGDSWFLINASPEIRQQIEDFPGLHPRQLRDTPIAGIVLTARVGSATSDAGRMMELDAIAAAVIGGTSLLGGQGTVWGALLGALVMASLDNGMSLMNTEAFWQPILKGGILVAAVAADMAGRKKS